MWIWQRIDGRAVLLERLGLIKILAAGDVMRLLHRAGVLTQR